MTQSFEEYMYSLEIPLEAYVDDPEADEDIPPTNAALVRTPPAHPLYGVDAADADADSEDDEYDDDDHYWITMHGVGVDDLQRAHEVGFDMLSRDCLSLPVVPEGLDYDDDIGAGSVIVGRFPDPLKSYDAFETFLEHPYVDLHPRIQSCRLPTHQFWWVVLLYLDPENRPCTMLLSSSAWEWGCLERVGPYLYEMGIEHFHDWMRLDLRPVSSRTQAGHHRRSVPGSWREPHRLALITATPPYYHTDLFRGVFGYAHPQQAELELLEKGAGPSDEHRDMPGSKGMEFNMFSFMEDTLADAAYLQGALLWGKDWDFSDAFECYGDELYDYLADATEEYRVDEPFRVLEGMDPGQGRLDGPLLLQRIEELSTGSRPWIQVRWFDVNPAVIWKKISRHRPIVT